MSVLAIDTATRARTVVVVATPDGEQVRGVAIRGQPVGTSLPAAITAVLPVIDVAVVVVTGPGTYTGVRAGMAGALGVAQARGLPLYGIGSLEVVASWPEAGDGAGDPWVVADAGRGALYVARRSAASAPRRVAAAAFRADGVAVLSTEPIPIDSLEVVDPVRALAHAVSLALSRPPLDLVGLTAVYTD